MARRWTVGTKRTEDDTRVWYLEVQEFSRIREAALTLVESLCARLGHPELWEIYLTMPAFEWAHRREYTVAGEQISEDKAWALDPKWVTQVLAWDRAAIDEDD